MKAGLRWEWLTPRNWGALEELFGEKGACGGCWCMTWRTATKKAFQEGQGDGNRAALKELAKQGVPVGVLLFAAGDDRAIGWCSVAPRAQFPALDRSRVLKPADHRPVWSVSCFFVRKDLRRRGLSVDLLHAAAEAVRAEGGERLEGYPVLPYTDKMPAAFAWTGLHQAFLDAGFHEAARHSEARPIMRLELSIPRV